MDKNIIGYIDCIHSNTQYARITVDNHDYFTFWFEGSTGSIAKNQILLQRFLESKNGDINDGPIVRFRPESNDFNNIAWDVEWLKEDQEQFAIPIKEDNKCYLLKTSEKDQWADIYGCHDPAILFLGEVYWIMAERGSKKQLFYPRKKINSISDLVFDKNLQRILIDCLDQSNVRKYLAERILPPLQEYFRNGDWESFEQVLLSYLQKSLADFFRNILIDSLEEKERYQAWKHKPNREYFKIKYPEQTFHFIDNEVNESIIEILNKIQLVAFDTEIRDEKIREIGVYYTNGEAKEWMSDDLEQFKQEIIQNDQIQVLAGHNLHFDIEYLHSHQLMTQEKKLIDTLILQSILYPCSRHSLRLEDEFRVGRHQAKVDAEDTLSRLSKQILLLARHSSETLEKWISLASPGLHQLFECIQEYRLSISLTDYVVKTEDDQENPPYWDKWMQTLDFVQTDIKTLLICPLSMMPELGVMIPNSTILDPDGYYLEEPNGLRINLLIERQKDKNSQINDLFVYISAFVQYARKHNQTSYLECCADWARYLLKDKKYSDLLASVCVSYETIFDQYQHQGSLNTIVPYSALANNKLVKLLTSKNFDRVLICDEEYAYKESNTDICSLKNQEIDKILPPGLNTIGLTQQEAENLDEDIPHGWRAWVKYSPREGWRLYKALADTQEYLKTIFNDSVKIEAYSLNTTDSKAYFQSTSWKISEQQVLLPPDSIYRADYLAQVGSAIISLFRQNKQRILVLLRNDDEKNYFKKVLSEQGVYIPEGTRLVQMERMEKRGFGLAIDSTKHALKWVFSARNNGTKQAPFDIVCLESWPLEDPIWFPQPTKKDLINLGKPKQDNPDEDNDINSDDDNEEAGEDNGIINISGERIRSREFLLHQLKHHFKLVVPLLSIAKELSFSDLYVLDSRFNRKLYENNEFSIGKDLKIELDAELNIHLTRRLVELGLKNTPISDGIPEENQWDSLVNSLFGVPSLRDYQRDHLRKIFPGDQKTVVIEEPTGSGKSLLFQFPALFKGAHTKRLSLVISPLKALMFEQSLKLHQLGFLFNVDFLSGDLIEEELDEIYQQVADGQTHLLFVSPERFRSKRFRCALEERLKRDERLEYWIFDEAHCISLWGYDFRPDYLYAASQVRIWDKNRQTPVILLSATLPYQIREELERLFSNNGNTTH